jgi:hypothetical protein
MAENSLSELREALLAAHRALINDARAMYISAGNKVPDPVAFWHLLIQDLFFQWLRPISEVIVALDEAQERSADFTLAQGVALVREELIAEAGPELTAKLQAARARDGKVDSAWARVLALVA